MFIGIMFSVMMIFNYDFIIRYYWFNLSLRIWGMENVIKLRLVINEW